jgi:hypothetical protein
MVWDTHNVRFFHVSTGCKELFGVYVHELVNAHRQLALGDIGLELAHLGPKYGLLRFQGFDSSPHLPRCGPCLEPGRHRPKQAGKNAHVGLSTDLREQQILDLG